MRSRDLLTLALRIMGFWVLISCVATMSQLVAALTITSPNFVAAIGSMGFAVIAYGSFAAALLLWAPMIAGMFDRGRAVEDAVPGLPDGPAWLRQVYVVVLRIAGVYTAIQVLTPLSRVIARVLHVGIANRGGMVFGGDRPDAVLVVLHLVVAAGFVFGADAIAGVFVRVPAADDAPRSPFDRPDDV